MSPARRRQLADNRAALGWKERQAVVMPSLDLSTMARPLAILAAVAALAYWVLT